MWYIGVDPILVRFGSLVLTWHGVFLTAGVALGAWVFFRQAERQGIARQHLTELVVWTVVAGYIGARLLQVFLYDWPTYAAEPWRILALNEGGLAVYGGLIGGAVAVAGYARWKGLPFWRLADSVAPALPLGLIAGRVGCTIAGDVCGTLTDGAWGLVYTHPGSSVPRYLLGVPTFPAPIVMIIANAGLLALLLMVRKRVGRSGDLFLVFLVGYSAARFVISFWQAEQALLLGLHPTQLIAVAVAVAAMAMALAPRPAGRSAC